MSFPRAEYFRNNLAARGQFLAQWKQRSATSAPHKKKAAPAFGGTWQLGPAVTNGTPICNPLLLTDATVIAIDCSPSLSGEWYKLTPDITGSYVNGTWTEIATLPVFYNVDGWVEIQYSPLNFASAVLPDGRVIVMGGEYNGPYDGLPVGAIYDPVANTWTPVSAPPGAGWVQDPLAIGDAQSTVLADGTFLLAACCAYDPDLDALFDATNLTWTSTGAPNAGSNFQDEQGYTLLPNGNVLTVDIWTGCSGPGSCTGPDPTNAEQYNPTTGTWSSAGNSVVSLVDPYACGNYEIGPAPLRPDGTVVQFGGNTGCTGDADPTGIYDSTTGVWSAGPNVPEVCGSNGTTQCDLADAPAAVLPNGNILFAADTGAFEKPTHFFEFTTLNAINQVADDFGGSYVGSSYYNFLVLPNGQILTTVGLDQPEFYTPTGSPDPSWAPVISTSPSSVYPGTTYTITGTQLNGLTQGAYYGDDVQAATNYPIVQITNSATGHVFYGRTFNFSTESVAPGVAVSTNFTVPANIEKGASSLVVIANGIPSTPVPVGVGYPLTTAASPTNGGTVTPASGTYYAPGTVVPLTATANAGYSFTYWTGNVANSNSATTSIAMTAPQSVTANFSLIIVATPTTTSVSSNNNPSFTTASGNSVTFTATVTSNSTVNEGTLTFSDPANDFTCSGGNTVPVSNGQASCTTSFTTEGARDVTGNYNGTVNFQTSSGFITQTVNNHTVVTGNQFCNQGAIAIPSTAGAATPYPSNIFVSGFSGNIGAVTVQLNNISSSDIPQTDLLLVGPTGAQIIPFASVGDSSTIGGVNVTLDDAASNLIPGRSPLTTGTYKPTSITGSTSLIFPAPAPLVNASNYAATDGAATLTSTFQNTAPNGTWALYAMDNSGNGAASIGGGWCVNISPATVQTTITTSPAGLLVSVDGGTATTAPLVETWVPGSSHTITTTSPQTGGTGVQYVWSNWSDSGAISHSITVPSSATTYTATFSTQYQLTTQASPPADGSVTPASGSYYAGGAIIPVTATAGAGFQFSNWTSSGGSFDSTTSASTNFHMPSAPATVTGNFASAAVQITLVTSPANLLVSVDGGTATAAPLVETWVPGSSHTITTTSPQSGGTGVQYMWSNWSDSGAISHSITVPSTATIYTATFSTQYQLTTQASPPADGSVTPASGSYYIGGAIIPVTATAGAGFQFSNWTSSGGSFDSTTSASTNFHMPAAPATVTGNFTTASAPAVTLNPTSLNFGTVYLLTPGSKNVTVKNTGNATLNISKVSVTLGAGTNAGDFGFLNLCPKQLAAGKSCTITVLFFAGNVGALSGTLNLTDNAPGSPQQVALSANVINPQASFNPSSLRFQSVLVGHSSTKNVTLTNTGTTALNITSVSVTGTNAGDFVENSSACPASLSPGAHCNIVITFTPGAYGQRSASLKVVDNSFLSPQYVPLSGDGSH
jgi:hypothetical protein